MAVSNAIASSLGKLARVTVGTGLSIVAHSLMSQDFADKYMSAKKYMRFHYEEIKTLRENYPNLPTKFNSTDLRFEKLQVKDNGESLVARVFFSEDIKKKLSSFYHLDTNAKIKLEEEPFYLVLRKVFEGKRTDKSMPPIIQFLQNNFNVDSFLVVSLSGSGAFNSFSSSLLLEKESPKNLNLVCFFDFIGKGNQAIAGINSILKGERRDTISNKNYINDYTSKFIFAASARLLKGAKETTFNSSSTYGLRTFFLEAQSTIKSISPVNVILPEMLKSWKVNLCHGKSVNLNPNITLSIEKSGHTSLIFSLSSTNIDAPHYLLYVDFKENTSKIETIMILSGMRNLITTKRKPVPELEKFSEKIRASNLVLNELQAKKEFIKVIEECVKVHWAENPDAVAALLR